MQDFSPIASQLHILTKKNMPFKWDDECKEAFLEHFSVHNMVTKFVGDKHERWPNLLGTVTLAYNATVHSTMGYSPMNFSTRLLLLVCWILWSGP